MTNKLVVIINSLKVPKIKKILLYEIKFLVSNYNCLQNPWLGGYRPQIPVLSVFNWISWTPPEKNSWVLHWLEYLDDTQTIQTLTPHEMSPSSVGSTIAFVRITIFLFIIWERITSNRLILFPTHTRNSVERLQNFAPAEHRYSELPTISLTN